MTDTILHQDVPIYVDLDGTLIFSDCLYESFLRLLRLNPLAIFLAFMWLFKGGREFMKAQIAQRVDIDVKLLPYNQPLIDWLREQKATGREIILATASHAKYAHAVAEHLDLFNHVLASDQNFNLKGANKLQRLKEASGINGFDYAGDSKADLKVWIQARAAIVVSSSQQFIQSVQAVVPVEQVFPSTLRGFSLAALRPHQWLKNVLLFVPIFTSHHLLDAPLVTNALIAFVALSMCASSVYILNDLLDIEEDRLHQHKRERPFAAGKASIVGGIVTLVCLLFGAIVLAAQVGPLFVLWLGFYYALTLSYSLYLKRVMILDILLLAGLYTIRIAAGAAAISVVLSGWLLGFSMLFFLSLSMVKRYADLVNLRNTGVSGNLPGRNYHTRDIRLIQWLGLASAYLAVGVLALYVNSDAVVDLYRDPRLLWLLVPLAFIWVNRVWWAAHQGEIHNDPVLFVIKDRFSQMMLFALALVVFIAS